MMRIALDAMGGDHGPEVTIPAALAALQRYPAVTFSLIGDQPTISHLLERAGADTARCSVVHAPQRVEMTDRPSSDK